MNRRLAIAALVMVAGTAVLAQQRDLPPPASSIAINDPLTASISGIVVDRLQQPIAAVSVRIAGEALRGSRLTLTDRAGRFAFERLPGTRYELFASRAGYTSLWFGQSPVEPNGDWLTVAPGQTITNITFALARYAVVSGVVTDTNGEPVAARITMMARRDPSVAPSPTSSVSTDLRGRFRVAAAAGDFAVLASPNLSPNERGIANNARAQSIVTVATFYPATTSANEAVLVHVNDGEDRDGVNIQMQSFPAGAVEGQIVHPSGSPVTATQITVRSRSRLTSYSPKVLPGGRFQLTGVIAGEYEIRAAGSATSGDGTSITGWAIGSVIVQPGVEPARITLTLGEGGAVRGRVVSTIGAIPSGARIVLMPRDVPYLPPTDNRTPGALVQPQGAFAITNVAPDRYRVSATLPSSSLLTVERVEINGSEISDLEVGAGAELEVVVRLEDTRTEISGTVTDNNDRPRAGVNVIAAPERFPIDLALARLTVRTDADGRYRFASLPLGTYRVSPLTPAGPAPALSGEPFVVAGAGAATDAVLVVLDAKGQKKVVDLRR